MLRKSTIMRETLRLIGEHLSVISEDLGLQNTPMTVLLIEEDSGLRGECRYIDGTIEVTLNLTAMRCINRKAGKERVVNTLAHELRHGWQYLNWSGGPKYFMGPSQSFELYYVSEAETDARSYARTYCGR